MINKIQGILINNFEWMKKDLIILISLILIMSATFRLINIEGTIQVILAGLIFAKCFTFSGAYSIQGGAIAKDQFSWKFLQGLPLSKQELIVMLTVSGIMSCIPFFVALVSFWPVINILFEDEKYSLDFGLWFTNSFLFIVLFGIIGIKNLILYPRKEYQRKNADKILITFIRIIMVGAVFLFTVLMTMDFLDQKYNLDTLKILSDSIKLFLKLIVSWWSVPMLIAAIVLVYLDTLKAWTDEKASYKSIIFNPKKEYSFILGSTVVLFTMYLNSDFKTPEHYKGDLQKAVYEKNYVLLEQELKKHSDIHNKNEYGMTSMLVAVREGNIGMVKFLEGHGANYDGLMGKKKNKEKFNAILLAIESKNISMLEYIFNKQKNDSYYYAELGFNPIHYAALRCQPRMVDYFIQNGTDVNLKNKDGESPLMVASREGCLSVAVTLKEHGAAFDIKDKKGKMALDLVMPSTKYYTNDGIKYFIEKNSRTPAQIFK